VSIDLAAAYGEGGADGGQSYEQPKKVRPKIYGGEGYP